MFVSDSNEEKNSTVGVSPATMVFPGSTPPFLRFLPYTLKDVELGRSTPGVLTAMFDWIP